jgi:hypothetical protein
MIIYNIGSEYIGSILGRFELNSFLTTFTGPLYTLEFVARINSIARERL